MNVILLEAFIGIVLVAGGVLLWIFSARQGDFDHAERIALLPLGDDSETPPISTTTARNEPCKK